jgi:hypothetical protein
MRSGLATECAAKTRADTIKNVKAFNRAMSDKYDVSLDGVVKADCGRVLVDYDKLESLMSGKEIHLPTDFDLRVRSLPNAAAVKAQSARDAYDAKARAAREAKAPQTTRVTAHVVDSDWDC